MYKGRKKPPNNASYAQSCPLYIFMSPTAEFLKVLHTESPGDLFYNADFDSTGLRDYKILHF